MKVVKNDTVLVVSGNYKGKKGKILKVFPKEERVIVEGVNFIKRHTRKSQKNPQGGIVEKEGADPRLERQGDLLQVQQGGTGRPGRPRKQETRPGLQELRGNALLLMNATSGSSRQMDKPKNKYVPRLLCKVPARSHTGDAEAVQLLERDAGARG